MWYRILMVKDKGTYRQRLQRLVELAHRRLIALQTETAMARHYLLLIQAERLEDL